jgi:hypothetical protein
MSEPDTAPKGEAALMRFVTERDLTAELIDQLRGRWVALSEMPPPDGAGAQGENR